MVSNSLFFGTAVHKAAKMENFSDEDILANSKGEVTHIYSEGKEGEEGQLENSDIDPNIFGELSADTIERAMDMGHIALLSPVLNINRLKNQSPTITKLLGLSYEDIEGVLYGSSYMVANKEEDKYPIGTILTEEQYEKAMDLGANIKVSYGASAIKVLMDEKGISTDGIILHYVPVMPFSFRYDPSVKVKDTKIYHSHNIDTFYHRILYGNKQLKRFMGKEAPETLVRNQCRILQETIDAYIDNGVRERVYLSDFGEPCDCLKTIARYIGGHKDKEWNYRLFKEVNEKKLSVLAKEYALLHRAPEDIPEDGEDTGYFDEYDEMIDADTKKKEAIFKRAEEAVKDSVEKIIKNRYPELITFHDELYKAAILSLTTAIDRFSYDVYHEKLTPNKDIRKDLLCGIIPHMDLVARHIASKKE